jgi:cellobiose phosphorylase
VCEEQGDKKRAKAYREHLKHLKDAIEKNAWDGDWYRRAYFDDGTPLGSAQNEECRIDSISNSWAVLSKAGNADRSQRAMAAVDQYLIRREEGLIQLFNPPFDKTPLDPGYIKGYVPGVRENGGQYTHAAIWTVMAFAELGDGDRATELYALLNPINHSYTRAGLHKYKVEPYVVAADIYGMYPHVGRGGWTWYTGSASWMYRSAIETILGLDMEGNRFRIKPRVPQHWNEFEMILRKEHATYRVRIERNAPQNSVDGKAIEGDWIEMSDDGREHLVVIKME